jgi:hypothetical protein
MSDEKPFAEVVFVQGADGVCRLYVAGYDCGVWSAVAGRNAVEAINAAVAQREAKLHARLSALRLVAAELADAASKPADWSFPQRMAAAHRRLVDHLRETLDANDEYVDPREAISYAVLAGQLQAKLEGAWMPLLDALLEKPSEVSELALKLMAALGLATKRWPFKDLAKALSDDELRAECARRGFIIHARTIRPDGERSLLELLESDLRPGEVFGDLPPVELLDDPRGPPIIYRNGQALANPAYFSGRSSCPHCNDMPYSPPGPCPECGVTR